MLDVSIEGVLRELDSERPKFVVQLVRADRGGRLSEATLEQLPQDNRVGNSETLHKIFVEDQSDVLLQDARPQYRIGEHDLR